jgi:periplasmic divalent cation tolerance protein
MLQAPPRPLDGNPMNCQHIIVFCSCPDEAAASHIAATLVGERLAACVTRTAALRSTYSWAGAVCDTPEVLLSIKTQASRYPDLEARIRALHPYELPEIMAIPVVAGSTGYLDWVTRESTGTATALPGSDRLRSS